MGGLCEYRPRLFGVIIMVKYKKSVRGLKRAFSESAERRNSNILFSVLLCGDWERTLSPFFKVEFTAGNTHRNMFTSATQKPNQYLRQTYCRVGGKEHLESEALATVNILRLWLWCLVCVIYVLMVLKKYIEKLLFV